MFAPSVRKFGVGLVAVAAVCGLAACGGQGTSQSNVSAEPPVATSSEQVASGSSTSPYVVETDLSKVLPAGADAQQALNDMRYKSMIVLDVYLKATSQASTLGEYAVAEEQAREALPLYGLCVEDGTGLDDPSIPDTQRVEQFQTHLAKISRGAESAGCPDYSIISTLNGQLVRFRMTD